MRRESRHSAGTLGGQWASKSGFSAAPIARVVRGDVRAGEGGRVEGKVDAVEGGEKVGGKAVEGWMDLLSMPSSAGVWWPGQRKLRHPAAAFVLARLLWGVFTSANSFVHEEEEDDRAELGGLATTGGPPASPVSLWKHWQPAQRLFRTE